MKKYLEFILSLLIAILAIVIVLTWQGSHSFIFAWTLNLMLMFLVLMMTRTFRPALTSGYFNTKKWENAGKIYEWFGINLYRSMLVRIGWEKLNKSANPVKKDLKALTHLEFVTRESEFGHLLIFFIVLSIGVFVGVYYGFTKSLWLHTLNLILNVYPIALQRYNRPRLQRAIKANKLKASA